MTQPKRTRPGRSPSGPKASVELITPERAQELLSVNTNNRDINQIHVAQVVQGQFCEGLAFGNLYLGVTTPVVTLCEVVLRGSTPLVCMNPGTRVTCRACRALAATKVAPDDNCVRPGGAS